MSNDDTLNSIIKKLEQFKDDKILGDVAVKVFDYTRYLLDDDENLTRTGNLNSTAKEALRKRTLELFGVDMAEDGGEI